MISVVVPVFNEEESIRELYEQLLAGLKKTGEDYEVIFIDDGSSDGTLNEISKLDGAEVIPFTKNFGKSQALQAGFDRAKGDYIITIDGDLQDDPAEIPHFLEEVKKGEADLICGWKEKRKDTAAKRLVSKIANTLTGFFTGTKVHDMNCGYKLYTKDVAKSLHLHGDMHRYVPALAAMQGFRIGEISVNHRDRQYGESKYGNFKRLPKSFFDFVTLLLINRYRDRPMHFFGIIGTVFLFLGSIILADLAYLRIFNGDVIGNRPLLTLGVLLVVIGVQLFSTGFIGELLIRQKDRKTAYRVKSK